MKDSESNLYKILGVAKSASADEIRSAYRKLARKYHPDVNPGDAEAEATFKKVAAAYDVLSSDEKRSAYDEFGDESLRGGFDPDKARDYRRWNEARSRGAKSVGQDGSDFDFGDIFGVGGGGFAGGGFGPGGFGGAPGWRGGASIPMRGVDVQATVQMDLRSALAGGEVTLDVPGKKPVTVRIPPGADDGSTIRLKGRGGPGANGGPAGDLLILTRVAPHPLIKRRGLDLVMNIQVSLDEAYNGAKIDVPTFDGPLKLRVPPLSQPGSTLRLRGKGVARKDKRGDLLVTLEVRLPEERNEALATAIRDAEKTTKTPIKREVTL